MDINTIAQLLQGRGGAPMQAPGGGPPGAGSPGAAPPPTMPPGMGGSSPDRQANAQAGGPDIGPTGFDPREGVAKSMMLFLMSMHQLGLMETAQKVIQMVTKAIERLNKSTPEGMQQASQNAALPPMNQMPGTGRIPGANVY
jgi:hypothetical protein